MLSDGKPNIRAHQGRANSCFLNALQRRVPASRGKPGWRKMMLVKVSLVAWIGLMAMSFGLGLASPVFASRKTIWKALGLWGLGLGAGVAAVVLSFQILALQGQQRAALIAAGEHVPLNDMPGFGQALLAAFGLMYFAALLAIIGLVFAIGVVRHRLALKQRRAPETAGAHKLILRTPDGANFWFATPAFSGPAAEFFRSSGEESRRRNAPLYMCNTRP